MLFHVIQHDRSGNESFATQCARIRTFSGVISPMNGKRGCLCKRLPTHGTKIRPLSRVNTLMHHVILAMCKTFAAYVAHERPGPMYSFVGSQRLDARELLRARVARIRDYRRFVRRRHGTANTARDRITGRYYGVGYSIVTGEDRLVSFRVMIVQISRLETHQASRAGVRLFLADLVHSPVPLEECTIPKARLATIAGECLLDVHRRRHRRDRWAGGSCRRGMRHFVHPQVTQSEETPRTNGARVSHRVLYVVIELGQCRMTRSYMVIQFQSASKLEATGGTRIGLGDDLHMIQENLIGTNGRQVGWDGLIRWGHHRRLTGEHGVVLKQGTSDW